MIGELNILNINRFTHIILLILIIGILNSFSVGISSSSTIGNGGPGAELQDQGLQITPNGIKLDTNPNGFISRWDTTLTSTGSSASNQIKLPLHSNGTYNFVVDWGDGSNDNITSWNQAEVSHTYTTADIYTLNITGALNGWRFNNEGDRQKIIEISQWGDLQFGDGGSYFYGSSNLVLTATDAPNLNGTKSLVNAFRSNTKLGSNGSMDLWDVSNVTDMGTMFYSATSFNQSISSWDVSKVTDLSWMFMNAISFNQPLVNWDTSSVTTMYSMFNSASSFNQSIGNWNVSGVTDMSGLFMHASSFNQPLGNWNVSNVTGMGNMFYYASSFNQFIGNWNVSGVTDMTKMFYYASSFNQPIGNWNVSGVTDMTKMFNFASSFNQPLGSWDVSSVIYMDGMFNGITLSTSNYDNLLIGWSQLSLQNGVTFDGGSSMYSNNSSDARQYIIDNFAWIIYDGGTKTVPSPPLSIVTTLSGDKTVLLAWAAPSSDGGLPISEYIIYRSTTSGSGYENIGNSTSLIYTDSDTQSGLTYYYVVVAVNNIGDSSFSIEASITIPSTSIQTTTQSIPSTTSPSPLILVPVIFAIITMSVSIVHRKKNKI